VGYETFRCGIPEVCDDRSDRREPILFVDVLRARLNTVDVLGQGGLPHGYAPSGRRLGIFAHKECGGVGEGTPADAQGVAVPVYGGRSSVIGGVVLCLVEVATAPKEEK